MSSLRNQAAVLYVPHDVRMEERPVPLAIHDTASRLGKEKGIPPSPENGQESLPDLYEPCNKTGQHLAWA
jgi:hypothetical protein